MTIYKSLLCMIAASTLLGSGCVETDAPPVKKEIIPVSIDTPFAQLDANGDNFIAVTEAERFNLIFFESADGNFDMRLSPKEYKRYFKEIERAQDTQDEWVKDATVFRDIDYAGTGHHRHTLDIYLPDNHADGAPLPLVIWVHGGGWRKGHNLKLMRQMDLLDQGYALASVNYRMASTDIWPAQIHDVKAAIRYLRANAGDYNIDGKRIGLWGASAGGHLVSMTALTQGNSDMEGRIGTTGVSSDVQAVLVWYGPSDMISLRAKVAADQKPGKDLTKMPIPVLFGGMPQGREDVYRAGSPLSYVRSDTPPMLLMHADGDPLVPVSESVNLYNALNTAGAPVELEIVDFDKHAFLMGDAEHKRLADFFNRELKGGK